MFIVILYLQKPTHDNYLIIHQWMNEWSSCINTQWNIQKWENSTICDSADRPWKHYAKYTKSEKEYK